MKFDRDHLLLCLSMPVVLPLGIVMAMAMVMYWAEMKWRDKFGLRS